jgi:hypothetical protein
MKDGDVTTEKWDGRFWNVRMWQVILCIFMIHYAALLQ